MFYRLSLFHCKLVTMGLVLLLASFVVGLGVGRPVPPILAENGNAQDPRPTPLPRTPVPITPCSPTQTPTSPPTATPLPPTPTATGQPPTATPLAPPTDSPPKDPQPTPAPIVTPTVIFLLPATGGERTTTGLDLITLMVLGIFLGGGILIAKAKFI